MSLIIYQTKTNFLVGIILIVFISVSQSQLNRNVQLNRNNQVNQNNQDVQVFATNLKSQLENTLPSLLKNISRIYQPLKLDNDVAAKIYINTLDAAKSLLKTGPSHAETGMIQKRQSVESGIKDIEDFIDFIVDIIVKGVVFGLRALLTPVIVLLQVLLVIVAILLNIILWIVRALLATLLTDLGAGGLGMTLSSILGDVQTAVDKILKDVEELLGSLTILKDLKL